MTCRVLVGLLVLGITGEAGAGGIGGDRCGQPSPYVNGGWSMPGLYAGHGFYPRQAIVDQRPAQRRWARQLHQQQIQQLNQHQAQVRQVLRGPQRTAALQSIQAQRRLAGQVLSARLRRINDDYRIAVQQAKVATYPFPIH